MKILFLHTNFPGQFKHVSAHFADIGHDVKFICQTNFGNYIKGVDCLLVKANTKAVKENESNSKQFSTQASTSEVYRGAFISLTKKGWIPDVVISHSGWGCGFYVKEIWPQAKLISYLEWWFDPTSDTYSYDPNNKYLGINRNSVKKHWARNADISLELATSDSIVSPTTWQRNQLPKVFKDNCTVIFDGIDLKLFQSIKVEPGSVPKLTYGTRGMEPMRAFSQFIKCLPEVVRHLPNLEVEIAGNDEINYGGRKFDKDTSWKQWAVRNLEENNISSSVKWIGQMSYVEYIKWLKSSWCHVYLTHPFVPSWSLAEAICCECNIICSDILATREYLIKQNDLIMVDHRKHNNISENIISSLAETKRRPSIRRACVERLNKDSTCHAWSVVAGLDLATQG